MSMDKVWVDDKFIQGTAWFLRQDIWIATTGSTPKQPYIAYSGNTENQAIPCPGIPLLIGYQLSLHYQSLLPSRESKEKTKLDFSKEEFPPLRSKPLKKRMKLDNNNQTNANTANRQIYEQQTNLRPKQNLKQQEECPNCKIIVESLPIHFKKSLICSQTFDRKKQSEKGSDNNWTRKEQAVKKHPENIKLVKLSSRKCKSCQKEVQNLKKHVTKSFTCQNAYEITEKLNCDLLLENNHREEHIRTAPKKPKTSCLGCSKLVLNIVLHLKRSEQCQPFYNLEDMKEEQRKNVRSRKSFCKRKQREIRRNENEEQYRKNLRSKQKEYRANKKEEDEEHYRNNLRSKQNEYNSKKKEEDEEQYRKNSTSKQN